MNLSRTWLWVIGMTVITSSLSRASDQMIVTKEFWEGRVARAIAAGYDPAKAEALSKSAAPTTLMADYAWHTAGHPTPAKLKAANYSGVTRYVSPFTNANGKNIFLPEYKYLTEGGITVALVYEGAADDCLDGAATGTSHAKTAVSQAKALGYPAGAGIYGACDFDVSSSQWKSTCGPYYKNFAKGIRAGGYRPGIYGPYDAIEWGGADSSLDFGWQASAAWSWSSNRNKNLHRLTNISQDAVGVTIDGQDCDRNSIQTDFYGQALPGVWPAEVVSISRNRSNLKANMGRVAEYGTQQGSFGAHYLRVDQRYGTQAVTISTVDGKQIGLYR